MKKMTLFRRILLLSALSAALPAAAQTMESHGSNDFRIGVAGYTYRKFTIEQTLAYLKDAGVKYLSVKDFHLPYDSTAEEMAAFKQKLAEAGVDGYILGPIYMRSEAEVDRAFEYTKRYGIDMFIGVPTYELVPYMEQKVKEYNIRVAIHTHGPDGQPFPDAADVMKHVGNLDPRIGICLDLGHTVRYGGDNVPDLHRYKDRIFDLHFKDVTAPSKAGTTWEMGRGTMNYVPIVKALKEIGYTGVCSLEFEKNGDDPNPGVRESLGYFRAVCDVLAQE